MTQNTLAIPGAPPCGDLRILVQETVRDLNSVGQPEAAAPVTTRLLSRRLAREAARRQNRVNGLRAIAEATLPA